jgi:hypothetical protein
MNEDFSRKGWADNHQILSSGIANLFAQLGVALQKLNAYQYDAPWRKRAAKPGECNCG